MHALHFVCILVDVVHAAAAAVVVVATLKGEASRRVGRWP